MLNFIIITNFSLSFLYYQMHMDLIDIIKKGLFSNDFFLSNKYFS
jgi:hypothetical protein